jgi:hypothetical protein
VAEQWTGLGRTLWDLDSLALYHIVNSGGQRWWVSQFLGPI